MRLFSMDTPCWLSTSKVCDNEPFDPLSIEAVAQDGLGTRYSPLNIAFQCELL